MKKRLAMLLVLVLLLCGCKGNKAEIASCISHTDVNSDGFCEVCLHSVYVCIDFYSINDLHGKLADADTHPGVDELSTYLKNARATDEYMILLSTGDMWQGSAESNLTKGQIMTEWMNALDFDGMVLGNHEYDWGSQHIADNRKTAEFPFLAINIFDRKTNRRVDYCDASVIVQAGNLEIGIIGAIGDCYSSIAVDKSDDVYFKTGKELTSLVKEESLRLQKQGVDFIVYAIHDGYGGTYGSNAQTVSGAKLSGYYDIALSDGYVDLVFEGHTHQGYQLIDEYGVYHLQNRGDNKGGISHVEIAINSVTNDFTVRESELISTQNYQSLPDDPIVGQLLKKYEKVITQAGEVLGTNRTKQNGNAMRQLVADLYYQAGVEKWGAKYDIVLGGGYMSIRSPGYLAAGEVTYGDLQGLFPFDNELILCSVKGRDLWNKFFATDNSNYFIDYGPYGESVYRNIDMNATYYIVVDSYSAYYGPNKLTVVETYGAQVFARDLLAAYIKQGGLR